MQCNSIGIFPKGSNVLNIHYLIGKRENSKAEIEMSFGFSPSLRFRGSRYCSPSFLHALSPRLFFVMPVFPMRACRIRHRLNLRKETPGKERLISKRFLKVGGEKLKAPQAGNADSEFSRWRHERGRAMRLEVFEIVCRASRNINRA